MTKYPTDILSHESGKLTVSYRYNWSAALQCRTIISHKSVIRIMFKDIGMADRNGGGEDHPDACAIPILCPNIILMVLC